MSDRLYLEAYVGACTAHLDSISWPVIRGILLLDWLDGRFLRKGCRARVKDIYNSKCGILLCSTNRWKIKLKGGLLRSSFNQSSIVFAYPLAGLPGHIHHHNPPPLHTDPLVHHHRYKLIKGLPPSSPGAWTPFSICVSSLLKGPGPLIGLS